VKLLTKYGKIRLICLCNLYHKSLQIQFSSANTTVTALDRPTYTIRFALRIVSSRDIDIAILSVYPSVCHFPLLYQNSYKKISSQFVSTKPIL